MRLLPVLLVAVIASGCVRTSTNPSTGKMDVDVESPMKKGEDWKTDMRSTMSGTPIVGSSTAMVAEGKTTVMIKLMGMQAGTTHPWHVHMGKCASGGPIVGSMSDYTPLTVGNDGTAQGSATLSVRLEESSNYHVNVHQSASNMETIIACGNLDDE